MRDLADELITCFERLLEIQEIKIPNNAEKAREKVVERVASILERAKK